MDEKPVDPATLDRAKINQETAKIHWHELQRFFAAGQVIFVAAGLDLVDVALTFSRDEITRVEKWLTDGDIHPVNDAQARSWLENDALLWAVVVKPWILVQPATN